MERSIELAKKAFNLIVRETRDDSPMDGDETMALVDELIVLLDKHFANV